MVQLHQKFETVEEMKSAISQYEHENLMQFIISHSRTIEGAKKRGLQKSVKPELHYAEITYSCINYGKYESNSKGLRPNQSTLRQGCPCKIVLKASEDGQSLEVVSMIEEHNHERIKANNMATLSMGDRFESYNDFKEVFDQFKIETNTDFYICDAKSLASGQKRCPARVANAPPELKYYYLKYKCIFGGEFKKSKSLGLRAIGTIRKGCPALLSLSLTPESNALYISALCLNHNHDTNKALYVNVPSGRKRSLASLKVPLTPSVAKHKRKSREAAFPQGTENVERLLNLFHYAESPNSEPIDSEPITEHMVETEIITDADENATYSVPEQEVQSGDPMCKCSIGSFDLTKQDLMKMEVEEHYHRLEVLQIQKAYESERIEKMRYLYDLKIKLAEQELQNINF